MTAVTETHRPHAPIPTNGDPISNHVYVPKEQTIVAVKCSLDLTPHQETLSPSLEVTKILPFSREVLTIIDYVNSTRQGKYRDDEFSLTPEYLFSQITPDEQAKQIAWQTVRRTMRKNTDENGNDIYHPLNLNGFEPQLIGHFSDVFSSSREIDNLMRQAFQSIKLQDKYTQLFLIRLENLVSGRASFAPPGVIETLQTLNFAENTFSQFYKRLKDQYPLTSAGQQFQDITYQSIAQLGQPQIDLAVKKTKKQKEIIERLVVPQIVVTDEQLPILNSHPYHAPRTGCVVFAQLFDLYSALSRTTHPVIRELLEIVKNPRLPKFWEKVQEFNLEQKTKS